MSKEHAIKTDADLAFLRKRVVGRTVVEIDREPDTDEKWPQYANGVTIRLDDGSTLEFDGWGYDASGLNTTLVESE